MCNNLDINVLLDEAAQDPLVGELLVKKIIEWGGAETSVKLMQIYPGMNEIYRAKIVEILGILGDSKIVDSLLDCLGQETSSTVKASMVKALGCFGNIDVIPILARYLNDTDTRVRANTIEGLSLIYDARIPDLLLPLLEDEDNRVRANSAIALWKYDELKFIVCDTFGKMLEDPSKWMRASAYYAFGEIDLEDFVLQLTQALGREDDEVCHSVIVALIGYAEKHGLTE